MRNLEDETTNKIYNSKLKLVLLPVSTTNIYKPILVFILAE